MTVRKGHRKGLRQVVKQYGLVKSTSSGQDVPIVVVFKEISLITKVTNWIKVIVLYNCTDDPLNAYRELEFYS